VVDYRSPKYFAEWAAAWHTPNRCKVKNHLITERVVL